MFWHNSSIEGIHQDLVESHQCPFCSTELTAMGTVPRNPIGPDDDVQPLLDMASVEAYICKVCGWWRLEQSLYGEFGPNDLLTPSEFGQHERAAVAQLASLDLLLDESPLEEVRRYLMARWNLRHEVHPRLFEETIGSVFRSIGFDSRVTSYSRDGGVDVILQHNKEKTIGVQVRRYKDKIKVESIRALLGALMIGRHCAGVYITTSDFQKGCYSAAAQASKLGFPIMLIEQSALREVFRIANKADDLKYDLSDPIFCNAPLQTYSYRPGACSEPYIYRWYVDNED